MNKLFYFAIAILLKGLLSMVTTTKALEPYSSVDTLSRRYDFSIRASQIDTQAREHPEIDFTFTDKSGKMMDLEHASVDTRVISRGKLVIWLMDFSPGLFDRVTGYGMHCIQVHYANHWTKVMGMQKLDSGKYWGAIRLEAATGEDFSPLVNIPKPDCIMERSLQFVKWLARENPPGKWEQFLTADGKGLRWDKVIMCGISHGSSTAARFAVHQKVDRVVMFSGPRDRTDTWQSLPSATPSNRFFGFSHVLDLGWTEGSYQRSWQMLGLEKYGPIVNVDNNASPPYSNTRRLITDCNVDNNPNRAHTAVIPGHTSCKDAEGRFIHENVWLYLFTHPVDQTGE